jgi:hypothetical protein
MSQIQDQLRNLSEIRNLMEQQSKFLSLSGLSGVSAGLIALLGVGFAGYQLGTPWVFSEAASLLDDNGKLGMLVAVATAILIGAVAMAVVFSLRLARRKGLPTWNASARRLVISLGLPLLVGAAYCVIQIFHGVIVWVPACTLLFYGLALLNASKHTVPEIRLLGYCELVLGLACAAFYEASLLFWAGGFGLLHVVYGIWMYYKYER